MTVWAWCLCLSSGLWADCSDGFYDSDSDGGGIVVGSRVWNACMVMDWVFLQVPTPDHRNSSSFLCSLILPLQL